MDFWLERIHSAIVSSTRGMSAKQLQWHPESKWSVAEILEHLSLTYNGTRIGCERCLQAEWPRTNFQGLQNQRGAWLHAWITSRQLRRRREPAASAACDPSHRDPRLPALRNH